MKYKIISGRYETGTEEQQMGYRQLFGGDVQYRFDLYFHWYNLIHELGHCVVEQYGKQMPKVAEEMFVNKFAISIKYGKDRFNVIKRFYFIFHKLLLPNIPLFFCFIKT